VSPVLLKAPGGQDRGDRVQIGDVGWGRGRQHHPHLQADLRV